MKNRLVGLIAMMIIAILNVSMAEDSGVYYSRWVFCNPDSNNEVFIRGKPQKNAEIVGVVRCGDYLRTDEKEKGSWTHVIDLHNETGEGWVFTGYLTLCEPQIMNKEARIWSRGRVASRSWVEGKFKKWIKAGSVIKVYAVSNGWAVTNNGYIKTDYIVWGESD